MVHKTVANDCFMNISRFWVRDIECMIPAVLVCAVCEFPMKQYNVIHETQRKLLYVSAMSLTTQKLTPCLKEILDAHNVGVTTL